LIFKSLILWMDCSKFKTGQIHYTNRGIYNWLMTIPKYIDWCTNSSFSILKIDWYIIYQRLRWTGHILLNYKDRMFFFRFRPQAGDSYKS
jgi:hypothetical protein